MVLVLILLTYAGVLLLLELSVSTWTSVSPILGLQNQQWRELLFIVVYFSYLAIAIWTMPWRD